MRAEVTRLAHPDNAEHVAADSSTGLVLLWLL